MAGEPMGDCGMTNAAAIAHARAMLGEVYKPEGVEIWLKGRKRSMGAQRPIALLRNGHHAAVFAAIRRLQDGTPS